MVEQDKSEYNAHTSKLMANVRSMEMLEKCSDEYCIILAESIRDYKLLGRPCEDLESKLEKAKTRMMDCTRTYLGRLPKTNYSFKDKTIGDYENN